MTDPLFLFIPKPGLTVRDPDTGEALPENGALKAKTTYWRKRLRDGDVSEGKAPLTPSEKTSNSTKKEIKA